MFDSINELCLVLLVVSGIAAAYADVATQHSIKLAFSDRLISFHCLDDVCMNSAAEVCSTIFSFKRGVDGPSPNPS